MASDNNNPFDRISQQPQQKEDASQPRTADDEAIGRQLKDELDTHLFDGLELGIDKKKEWMNMIKQTETVKVPVSWWTAGRKRLVSGAVAAVFVLGIGIPLFLSTDPLSPGSSITNPGVTQPADPGTGGSVVNPGSGSELSPLVTEQVSSLEEAETAFGAPILLPGGIPEGYELVEIATVGYPDEAALRVHFQYETADGGYLTFSVDKQEAFYPVELFSAIDLGGIEGQVFAQETLTELFWKVEGIQYSLVGTVTEEQAKALASTTVSSL